MKTFLRPYKITRKIYNCDDCGKEIERSQKYGRLVCFECKKKSKSKYYYDNKTVDKNKKKPLVVFGSTV